MGHRLVQQFAEVFADIIAEEIENEISCIAGLYSERNEATILVIVSSEASIPKTIKDRILTTAQEVAQDFGRRFLITPVILSKVRHAELYEVRDKRRDLDEERSFVAHIVVLYEEAVVFSLLGFCRYKNPHVLYNHRRFAELLHIVNLPEYQHYSHHFDTQIY